MELAQANEELRREIVERRLVEERLEQSRLELAQVSRFTTVGVLTASIAHEVTPAALGNHKRMPAHAFGCWRLILPELEGARDTARRTSSRWQPCIGGHQSVARALQERMTPRLTPWT